MNTEKQNSSNLDILFEKILKDKTLAENFAKNKTLDEFYDFCTGVSGGYTKAELDNRLKILGKLALDVKNVKVLSKEGLKSVLGGFSMNSNLKKLVSSVLAALIVTQTIPSDVYGASDTERPSEKNKSSVSETLKKVAVGAGAVGVTILGGALGYLLVHKEDNDDELCDQEMDCFPPTPTPSPSSSRSSSPSPMRSHYSFFASNVGLPNVGNSCFMNALIQQLYSLKAVRNRVLNYSGTNIGVCGLRRIFEMMDKNSVSKDLLTRNMEYLGCTGNQEDTIEVLAREYSDSLGDRPILHALGLPDGFITQAYTNYDDDILHMGDSVDNPGRLTVVGDPAFFSGVAPCDGQFAVCVNRNSVEYLNLERKKKQEKPLDVDVPFSVVTVDQRTFWLTGAVVHWGSLADGHYISYKRDIFGPWYCYNDSDVSRVSNFAALERDVVDNGVMYVYSEI